MFLYSYLVKLMQYRKKDNYRNDCLEIIFSCVLIFPLLLSFLIFIIIRIFIGFYSVPKNRHFCTWYSVHLIFFLG